MITMKKILLGISFIAMMLCSCKQQDSPKIILQICTGGWFNKNYTSEQIIERLETVTDMVQVEKVIIGWNLEQEQYLKVGEYLHSKGIEMIFWMPVFSEIGHLETAVESVDLWGNKVIPFNLQEGEDFTFYCPSNPINTEAVKAIYTKYFSQCGFDGVFLDKIRTASFVMGKEGVLSCGCENCRAIYGQQGLDLEALRELTLADNYLDEALFHKFLSIKADIVSASVAALEDWFHAQGMSVGLDLFAPSLASIVGQDYAALSQKADFVKPMMYRQTNAPAGIGFETRAFLPEFDDTKMTKDYLVEELRKAAASSNCPVYPGIEINYREDIARTSPEYVQESIQAVKEAGLPGVVLAWDVMLAPDSHVAAAVNN